MHQCPPPLGYATALLHYDCLHAYNYRYMQVYSLTVTAHSAYLLPLVRVYGNRFDYVPGFKV